MFKRPIILAIYLLVTVPVLGQSFGPLWVMRYDGPASSTDRAYAMTVDGSGNVYVTGYSFGIGTSNDYATVRYYTNGDTAWVRRYNGPGNDMDWAWDIAVDDSGYVYVTGRSIGSGTSDDCATIKYCPNGDTAWVRRYNTPAVNYSEQARAIAVDGSGNVCIAGTSHQGMAQDDYLTVKYTPNGNQLWAKTYNDSGDGYDDAEDVAVDGSGNVFVTGGITRVDVWPWIARYVTIKYSPGGYRLWVKSYDGGESSDHAWALAVDGSGNVYVTGESGGSGTFLDYATVKYDPYGNQLWVKRYDGPANNSDRATAITLDGSGNAYVTGDSYGGSGTNLDYATIKYSASGSELWVKRYNGPANSVDVALDIAVDDSGNVYVTGYSGGSGTGSDYATVKYGPNGTELWVKRYNGPGDGGDEAWAIGVDDSQNVYVTGASWGSGTYPDYATIKYGEIDFLRSDADANMSVEMSDAIYTLKFLYVPGSPAPQCMDAGDSDDNGTIEMADAIYTLKYLYVPGSPPPPAPGPDTCGYDPTLDGLDCQSHPCMGDRQAARKKVGSVR